MSSPLGLAFTIFLVVVVLFGQRRWALLALVISCLFLTQSVGLSIAGLNVFAHRIMEVAAIVRVLSKKELQRREFTKIDMLLVVVYACVTLVYALRTSDGIAYRIGTSLDFILSYFAFRGLFESDADLWWLLKRVVVCMVPLVALLWLERSTQSNPLSFMGGIESDKFMRGGKVRCWGAFRHPSLLGTVGPSFLPFLIAAMLCEMRVRWWTLGGSMLCLLIVFASNSGGPLSATAAVLAGWFLWPMRRHMRLFRWSGVIFLLALAATMKASIAYLPARISDLTGGDGWHRSYLLEQAFAHFDKWWLAGVPIKDTADWFPYVLGTTGGVDVTNAYLGIGLQAGVGCMALFIYLLIRLFRQVGESLTLARKLGHEGRSHEYMLWAAGVAQAMHAANWLGISYFDQSYLLWTMEAAVTVMLSTNVVAAARSQQLQAPEAGVRSLVR